MNYYLCDKRYIGKSSTLILNVVYYVAFFYYWYRYPFQINDSQTSPVYTDTPFYISLIKYFLISLILFVYIPSVIRLLITKQDKLLLLPFFFIFYGFVISVVNVIFGHDILMLEVVFFSPFMLIPLIYKPEVIVSVSNKMLLKVAKIFILVDVIQVFLYFYYDRLPALGWPNSFSVRFGSLLDDPNGFAFICPLFLFCKFSNVSFLDFIFKISLWGCIFATQSVTGIAAVIFSYLILHVFLIFFLKNKSSYWIVFSIFLLSATLLFLSFIYSDVVNVFLLRKSGSVSGHLESFSFLSNLPVLNYFFYNIVGHVGESGYVNILANSGVFFLLFYVFIGVISVYFCCDLIVFYKRKSSGFFVIPFLCASFAFIVAYLFGNINLPLCTVYPVNMLYFLISGMIFNLHINKYSCEVGFVKA